MTTKKKETKTEEVKTRNENERKTWRIVGIKDSTLVGVVDGE